MKYLLDTDTCVHVLRSKVIEVLDRFSRLEVGDVGISVITLCELEYGVFMGDEPEKSRAKLQKFVAPLEVLTYDPKVAPVYGRIRSELRRKGTPIGLLDLLIAAQAVHHDLILVTNNTAEFSRVPGIRLENWIKPAR